MERREFIFATGTVAALASNLSAFAQAPSKPEDMHPPKYNALEGATAKCVANGEDCLRHCLGMLSMKDTSMAACTNSVIQLIAVCRALQTLASLNSTFTVSFAKDVAAVCDFCGQENRKFSNIAECRACADACKACADECRRLS